MDCCSILKKTFHPSTCPDCNTQGQSIKVRTIKHWLKAGLVPLIPEAFFYLCKNMDCPVVYFSEDGGTRYTKDQLRYPVGVKERTAPITLCYCFGVTEEMILSEIHEKGKSSFSTWIAREIKLDHCACDVRNPVGHCCLGEIKRFEKDNELKTIKL
ncbi:MAG: copper chaperone Copz family protein [Nitrospirae bacterium]|nr:copper chaperone Copz family protein [Nitrospirota bacterium]